MSDKSKKLIILEKILRLMAAGVLGKYKPKIVAITGSVGKTSTREAVYTVLKNHFRVRKGEKNYNNEIGIPLTVIGVPSGGRSVWQWILIFIKWLGILILPIKYPEVLVLELGADRPGDIKYLTSFAKPDITILTDISGSHLEFFKTIEGVAKEKGTLVRNLKEKGVAVLNIDNEHIKKIGNQIVNSRKDLKISGFGFSEEADVRATDVLFNYSNGSDQGLSAIKGLSFKLNYKGTIIPMRLNFILARHNIYSALAAICVGMELGINLVEIGESLSGFCLPYGRMSLISGIKNSFIIDDSYNASPVSTMAALEIIKEIKAARKIAVLGDMLELGELEKKGHEDVAQKFLEIEGDLFFSVGKRMARFAVPKLEEKGFPGEKIKIFASPMEAGRHLQEIIQEGDLILIKGSQGMRMEKIVEEVMADPLRASNLLCRQDKAWKEKIWKEV